MSKQIEALRKLGLSDEEIQQVLADDKRIDKGEKLFELTAEQEKASKKARQADRAPTIYKFQKRERKTDEDKRVIINRMISTLENWFQSNECRTFNACTEINVTNAEREFTFVYNGKKYKVVLSAPRS